MPEHNSTNVIVIPEVPKVISDQEVYVYVPEATNNDKGIAKFDSESLTVTNGNVKVKKSYIDDIVDTNDTVASKQDKDNNNDLNTVDKSIVGAINENRGRIDTNTVDIQDLKDKALTGLNYVAQIESETEPTDEELTAKVVEIEQRQPENNDYIQWLQPLQPLENGEYNLYRILYKQTIGWEEPDLLAPLSKASNGRFGVIKGGYNQSQKVNVDIQNGKFQDIKYENVSVPKQAYDNKNDIAKIIAGTQKVGHADKSDKDAYGNVITSTYRTIADSYTKSECNSKFLSSMFSNMYYYTSGGIKDDVPTQTTPQFSKVLSVGENLIFENKLTLQSGLNFTKNTSDSSTFYFTGTSTQSISFKLVTELLKPNNTRVPLSVTLTGQFVLDENIREYTITSIYNDMETPEVMTEENDQLVKTLYIIADSSVNNTANMYSNRSYPSTFQLSSQTFTFTFNQISGKKVIEITDDMWIADGDKFKLVLTREQHEQAPSKNYGVELQRNISNSVIERIPCSFQIDGSTGTITILSDQAINGQVLIWGAYSDQRETLYLTDPTGEMDVDYMRYDAVSIKMISTPTPLTLKRPTAVGNIYSIFVINEPTSSGAISVDDVEIAVGTAKNLVWTGTAWVESLSNAVTSAIYDDANNRPLNDTLGALDQYCTDLDATKADASDLDTTNARLDGVIGVMAQAVDLPNGYSAEMFTPENHPTSMHIMGKVTNATSIPDSTFSKNGSLELIVYDNNDYEQVWHPISASGEVRQYIRGHNENGFSGWVRMANVGEVNSLSMCPSATSTQTNINPSEWSNNTSPEYTAPTNGYIVLDYSGGEVQINTTYPYIITFGGMKKIGSWQSIYAPVEKGTKFVIIVSTSSLNLHRYLFVSSKEV